MSDILRDLVKETTTAVVSEVLPELRAAAAPRLLSLEDTARYLDVSLSLLREMIERKEILTVRLGRLVKCDRRDLDAMIEARKHAA